MVVQHGRGAILDYLPPSNYKMLADRICVWGTRDQEMMLNGGFDPARIVLTGCPLFDGLKNERKRHKGLNVLFAPAHSTEDYAYDDLSNMEIMAILRSIKGINIIVKLLSPHKNRNVYGKNIILSNSYDNDHFKKCIEAVKNADILISNQPGTIELIAMYFNLPVIYVKNSDPTMDERISRRFNIIYNLQNKTRVFGVYFLDKAVFLPEAINDVLNDPGMLEKSRKEELLASAGIGLPGSPTLKIVETIKGLVK